MALSVADRCIGAIIGAAVADAAGKINSVCVREVDCDLIALTAASTLQTKSASAPSLCFDSSAWFLQFHAVFRSFCVYFLY